jgi:hypothetical protein
MTVDKQQPTAMVILVLDGSMFCVSRIKNGEEKYECEWKWRGWRRSGSGKMAMDGGE